MMILAWIVFGLVVGAVARALYPGPAPMGLGGTTLVGVAGSFVGGALGSALSGHALVTLHPSGLVGSVVGAVVVLAALGLAARRART